MGNEVGWENIGNVCRLGRVHTRGYSQITAFKEEIIRFSFFQVKLLRAQTNTFQLSGYSGASAYYLSFQINLAFPHTWGTLYRAILCLFLFWLICSGVPEMEKLHTTFYWQGGWEVTGFVFLFFFLVREIPKSNKVHLWWLRGRPICSCNNRVLVAAAISVRCQAEDIYCGCV